MIKMPEEKEEQPKMTKAQELRKTTKPIMEKRRRARINSSLCELKGLLLDVMKKEGARTNKMEKADILEMTVKHLRSVQRQQFEVAMSADPSVFNKYQSGFNECATEVSRYLSTVEGIDLELRGRLINHLSNCVQTVDTASPHTRATPPATAHVRPMQLQQQNTHIAPVSTTPLKPILTLPEINNNVIPNIQGVVANGGSSSPPQDNLKAAAAAQTALLQQTLHNKAKNADVAAFVIPSNILSGAQMPGYIIPLYSGNRNEQVSLGHVPAQPTYTLPTVLSQQLPIVGTLPINLQEQMAHIPSPTQSPPESPNSESIGMDLTLETKHREEQLSMGEMKPKDSDYIDFKVPIAIPPQRGLAPAQQSNESMWRPW